jgi:hypothetical protein
MYPLHKPQPEINHVLTQMVMNVYDASCEWMAPFTVNDPNSPEDGKEFPGRWQFNASVFRQRLDLIFDAADTARFNDSEENRLKLSDSMTQSGVTPVVRARILL